MKEQAQLKEEMAYQYKIGNFEVRKSNFVSLLTVISIDSLQHYWYVTNLYL